jgi:hypothetical protein
MQRSFSGSFRVDRPTPGWWRVRNTQSPHQIAWLRNLRTTTGDIPVDFNTLRLQWNPAGPATVSMGEGDTARLLIADAVQLHEPDERLYDDLPLECFTPGAQRFWRRVFWLVRLPGGRALLGLVARRRRA